jgi:hypothetical protein
MSDTKILPSHWLEEGPEVSEHELRAWMADISKDLKESIASQARHSQESAVYRAANDARVKNLEDHIERRSAFKSGLTMAGIATFFGALAAAIGRKTGLWALLAVVILAGCGTPESLKETNYLNGEAAKWIVEASPDPAIDRAASSIVAGSAQIERKLGEPELRPVYTAETHEKKVAEAKDDLDKQEVVKHAITGWIETAVTKAGDLIWPGLGGLLLGAWAWVRKKTQYDKLKAGAQVVVRAGEKIPAMKEATAALAGKLGVGKQVDDVVQGLLK